MLNSDERTIISTLLGHRVEERSSNHETNSRMDDEVVLVQGTIHSEVNFTCLVT